MKLFKKEQVKTTVIVPNLQEKATAVIDNLKTDLLYLNQEADDALASFRYTAKKLESVNSEIQLKKTLITAQIAELNALSKSLTEAETANKNIAAKISELLS